MGCASGKYHKNKECCPCKRRMMHLNEILSLKDYMHLDSYSKFVLPLKSYIQPKSLKQMLSEMKWLPKLQDFTLEASNKDIGNDGLNAIAQSLHYISHIQNLTLRLCFNFITDKHMKTFSKNLIHLSNLKSLSIDLWSNTIDNYGLVYLCEGLEQLTQLEHLELNLSNTDITSIGSNKLGDCLKSLTKLSTLKLSIAQNQLTSDGITEICKALSTLPNLQELYLDLFECGLDSIDNLTAAFKNQPLLRIVQLNLGQNHLQNEDIRLLNKELYSIISLEKVFLKLKNIKIDSNDDLVMLRTFQHIKEKGIMTNTIETDDSDNEYEMVSISLPNSNN